MAMGIDDALSAIAAGINLTDTVVETIKRYKGGKSDDDLAMLIEEIRLTAFARLRDADLALSQFERMLVEKGIDLGSRLQDVIAQTPFWRPFEQHRLNQIQKRFNEFSDGVYSASNDIAALVRCRNQTGPMGLAIITSAQAKHALHQKLLNASSFKEAIWLLRQRIVELQQALA